ncbi:hypothetical protein GLOTRDRAFT_124481 [Gloeophyllum trabeum ATCC 11539]|uniref:Uncharacterized protein n=1 Tax=Gloeophyllum trabeum (strain ATCC 11539 / FP-39264 / Madison 617) TaxID=670483 RepID=S7QMP3_GLOTA|nr:uncharacterized protein GLOTRDRAFT_124481 [Gloeophyllum trabeum ATCC 11539]EPQ60733.1 hypothetical protein GLOTRDRAFT_124481 [Gloeophyllum trabeum ATCC 11539]
MSRPFLLQATRRAVCPISLRSQGLRYYAAHAAASHTVSPSREAGSPESSSAAGPSSVPLDAFSDAAVNGNKGSLKGSDGKRPRSKKIKKASREPREMPPRTSRTILDPFEDELRLTSLIAARPSPLTLSDIERYRVARKSRQEEPSYVEEYNQLVDALCRAFSKGQLTKFARMYGMKVGPKQKKIDIAEDIIEKQWQWPSLEEIEKQKRERTEVVEKLFTVDAPQLFHILGKDGADLLQLSMDYNVHVSLVSNPLALRVEGSPGSIKQLSRHIHSLKQSIISETVHLPSRTAIPREMLQQISRTVNAFIENIDLNGKVKVYARSTQALSAAMRFVVRTDLTALALRPRPLLSFLSQKLITSGSVMPFPQSYSFYPFLPPQSMSVGTNAAGSFRVRRVGQWLGPDYAESSSLQDRALSAGTGHTYDIHGDAAELKQTLFDGSSDKEPPQTVTATIGHILFASNVPKRHMSLTPPLQGQLPMSRILEWIATTHPKIQFIPRWDPSPSY